VSGDDGRFSLADLVAVNTQARAALGKAPERFGTAKFIGMIGDEIDGLRSAGRSWAEIADLLEQATGEKMEVETLREHHEGAGESFGK
jgi:hypothetical protein